jgi:hypothetical protein
MTSMEVVHAHRQHEQQSAPRRAGQGHREVLCRAVRPVHVFHHDHQGAGGSGLEHGQAQILQDAEGLTSPWRLRVEKGPHPSCARSPTEVLERHDEASHGLHHGSEGDPGAEVEAVAHDHREAQLLGVARQI